MTRIPPLPPRQWSPEMGEALRAMTPANPRYSLSGEKRPKGANILGVLAHHPALARPWFALNGHLLRATTLTERQRELVMMRVAVRRRSGYQWAQHVPMARDAGITDLEIANIAWGPDCPFWDRLDSCLIGAVDELTDHGALTEQTWTVLAEQLDTQQILDLIFTVGVFSTTAWMVASLGVDLDDDLRDYISTLIRPPEDTPGR